MSFSLIIAAAGKNTRLSKYYFPKVLLPLYNKAMVSQIMDFWGANDVIIVANKQNIDIISKYVGNNANCVVEDRIGSAYAVETGIKNAKYDNVIINWCDVVPTAKPEFGNFVFTSPDIICRYNGKTGGIYGVFCWNKNKIKIECKESVNELDLLDVLDINKLNEIVIPALDIGDLKKYTEDLRFVETPVRPFNKIIIENDRVIKICNNEQLKHAEENWYKNIVADFIPKVLSYNPLTLERINGVQKFNRVEELYYLAKRINFLLPPIKSNPEDCWDMYIYKTIKRLKDIDFLFSFKNEFVVNCVLCNDPVTILEKLDITDMIPEQFVPIHGDLTTSNVLWTDRPYVIDPRGIFGKTLLYGDPDYDVAKIYYSKTNWHLLNKGKLIPEIISENVFGVDNILPYGNKKIDFLLAIIWLSVAEYVKSNVLSSLYAYLTGSYLLARWKNE